MLKTKDRPRDDHEMRQLVQKLPPQVRRALMNLGHAPSGFGAVAAALFGFARGSCKRLRRTGENGKCIQQHVLREDEFIAAFRCDGPAPLASKSSNSVIAEPDVKLQPFLGRAFGITTLPYGP
jgi:hypothetical protein